MRVLKFVPADAKTRELAPTSCLRVVMKGNATPHDSTVMAQRRGWIRLDDLAQGERRRWLRNYRAANAARKAKAA